MEKRIMRYTIPAGIVLFCHIGLLCASDAWIQLSPTGPMPSYIYEAPIAYDQQTNHLMIFDSCRAGTNYYVLTNANGIGGPSVSNLLPTSGVQPGPLCNEPSAVYDRSSNRLIIFGGEGPNVFDPPHNNVWVLSNANGNGGTPEWTLLSPGGTRPSARIRHRAVYDDANNRMIIFGGCA